MRWEVLVRWVEGREVEGSCALQDRAYHCQKLVDSTLPLNSGIAESFFITLVDSVRACCCRFGLTYIVSALETLSLDFLQTAATINN